MSSGQQRTGTRRQQPHGEPRSLNRCSLLFQCPTRPPAPPSCPYPGQESTASVVGYLFCFSDKSGAQHDWPQVCGRTRKRTQISQFLCKPLTTGTVCLLVQRPFGNLQSPFGYHTTCFEHEAFFCLGFLENLKRHLSTSPCISSRTLGAGVICVLWFLSRDQ